MLHIIIPDDDTTNFLIRMRILNDVKTRLEKTSRSVNELAAEDRRWDFKTSGNKKR